MGKKTEPITEASSDLPAQGGSYSRDPVTGELTLMERTKHTAEDDDAINFDAPQSQE